MTKDETVVPGVGPKKLSPKDAAKAVTTLIEAHRLKTGQEELSWEELSSLVQDGLQGDAEGGEDGDDGEMDVPKVLQFLIFYGTKRSEDEKGNPVQAPDPATPMYYYDPVDDRTFDCNDGSWIDGRHPMLDRLYSREFTDENNNEDLVNAILHGVVDEDDIVRLSSVEQMFDPRLRKLYDLTQRASTLIQLRVDQNAAILQNVSTINETAEQIARLNGDISQVIAFGDQPNDLLDERDRLLDSLSEIAGATSRVQDNGEVTVSIGGHALVVGNQTFSLQTAADPTNDNLDTITWEDGLAFQAAGGALNGQLRARDSAIPTQQTNLDNLAAALLAQVNAIHQNGYGLNNATGLDFFTGSDALSLRVNAALADVNNIAAAAQPASPGDGSLAGQIAGIQYTKLMSGGSATLNEFVTDQASALGLAVNQASIQAANHKLVTDSLAEQRESITGVSLDEEAANLIQSQRAYQAASRVITVLDEMLDKVINGMGVVGR